MLCSIKIGVFFTILGYETLFRTSLWHTTVYRGVNLVFTLKEWFAGAHRGCLRGMCLPLEKADFFVFVFFVTLSLPEYPAGYCNLLVSYTGACNAPVYCFSTVLIQAHLHAPVFCFSMVLIMLIQAACELKISKFGGLWAENFQIWGLVS